MVNTPTPMTLTLNLEELRELAAAKPYNLYRGTLAATGAVLSLTVLSSNQDTVEPIFVREGGGLPGASPLELKLADFSTLECRPDDNYVTVMSSEAKLFRGIHNGKLRLFSRAEHFNFGRGFLMHSYDPALLDAKTLSEGYVGIVSTDNIQDLKAAPEFG
jgi:hypothetical protein